MQQKQFSITAEQLKDECLRRKYLDLLERPEVFPSLDNWSYIIDRRLDGLGRLLYRKFLVASLTAAEIRSEFHQAALDKFPVYLTIIDRNEAIDIVYSDVVSDTAAFVDLVYKCQLFDSESIARLIDDGHLEVALEVLLAYQPEYDGDSVDAMKYLSSKFDKLPEQGELQKRRVLFRTEDVYICPNGHVNPIDCNYCRADGCGLDIYGLSEMQHNTIEQFRQRIAVLQDMLG